MDTRWRVSKTLRTWLAMVAFGGVATVLFVLGTRLLVSVSPVATVTFQVLAGFASLFTTVSLVGVIVRLIWSLVRFMLGYPRESRFGLNAKPQKFT